MQKQQGGHIVNISSLLGRYPLSGSSAYSASKYAVAGLSDALHAFYNIASRSLPQPGWKHHRPPDGRLAPLWSAMGAL